ncbi:hypothetical protein AB0D83_02595 [Streptomyces decoyicus]|uniref:hypothetical protein n=1 Tax=Streptomyces decoyicus TaxID=249567 RepID=UPI0033C46C2D
MKLLKKTANHHLLTEGLVYPAYYTGLPSDLRLELTAAVHQAQAAPDKGLWPSDVTMAGAKVTGMSSITKDVVIFPKLFRRLKEYLALGNPSRAGFPACCRPRLSPAASQRCQLTVSAWRCLTPRPRPRPAPLAPGCRAASTNRVREGSALSLCAA